MKIVKKKSTKKADNKEKKIPLSHAINMSKPIHESTTITNAYLKVLDSERNIENAYYNATLCHADGTIISPITIAHKYTSKKPDKIRAIKNVVLYRSGIVDIMRLIQTKEIGFFSEITMYAQERSVEYSGGGYYAPSSVNIIQGRHYFLDLILGEPGKKVKLFKVSQVEACKNCDRMLLRYSYDWVPQCDDLAEKTCPYCQNPLEPVERDRRYVEVKLDFDAKDCEVTGTNNQIGIIYFGRPIKTTVKVKALLNFLMNFQNLFPSKVIGPLDINLNITRSHRNFITRIEPSELLGEIEWRPVVLFPEDLIAI